MSRLTKRIEDLDFYKISSAYIDEIPNQFLDKDYVGEAINKLGKLEDLEEELGCPLDFIFKVLKAPKIYIEGMNVRSEYDNKFKFNSKSNNYILNPYAIEGKNPQFLFIDRWGYGYDLRLSDYKKTWFLKKDRSE